MLNTLGDVDLFLDTVFKNVECDKINVSNYELDHICYRVSTYEKYLLWKKEVANFGVLISEAIVSGREISTFKLDTPYIYNGRKISVLEIPSPKIGSIYPDGFEHVEFVITETFENFMNMYPDIAFGTKALAKSINPDIKRKYDNCAVKFHHHSLEYIIEHFEK